MTPRRRTPDASWQQRTRLPVTAAKIERTPSTLTKKHPTVSKHSSDSMFRNDACMFLGLHPVSSSRLAAAAAATKPHGPQTVAQAQCPSCYGVKPMEAKKHCVNACAAQLLLLRQRWWVGHGPPLQLTTQAQLEMSAQTQHSAALSSKLNMLPAVVLRKAAELPLLRQQVARVAAGLVAQHTLCYSDCRFKSVLKCDPQHRLSQTRPTCTLVIHSSEGASKPTYVPQLLFAALLPLYQTGLLPPRQPATHKHTGHPTSPTRLTLMHTHPASCLVTPAPAAYSTRHQATSRRLLPVKSTLGTYVETTGSQRQPARSSEQPEL